MIYDIALNLKIRDESDWTISLLNDNLSILCRIKIIFIY